MHLTRTMCYAIEVLVFLSRSKDGEMAETIARGLSVTEPKLQHAFAGLRRGGLIGTRRNRRIGYVLLKPPREISLAMVWRLFEERIPFGLDLVRWQYATIQGLVRDAESAAKDAALTVMGKVTLAQLIGEE